MNIKGVIFDMDGVILDSEKLYVRFWKEAGRACGYPWEVEHSLAIRSLARPYAIERLKGFFGEDFDYDRVRNMRIELMNAYIAEHGIEPKPHADYILNWLRENGYKIAVATATPLERTEEYLRRVGLLSYFDKIISAHMVEHGKPAPDIYLRASKELGLSPEECVALEDSLNGLRSANSAGCNAVMVPDLDEPNDEAKKLICAVAADLKDVQNVINHINGEMQNV
ncbi:MAG: HAD family phosphatase [Ruminococcus sp.]|nr:HAD family phosphatase [Ruminococcus sp.]